MMAGVPSIMQAMLDEVAPKLQIGVRMLSEIVRADTREGDIGTQLGEIAKANLGVAIGSYPFFDPQHRPNTNSNPLGSANSFNMLWRNDRFAVSLWEVFGE